MNKCQNCPYHLGLIKCVLNPCIECSLQKRKTHPFKVQIEIHEGQICAKCGSNHYKIENV